MDEPVRELGSGQPKVWVAPNREYAVRLVRADLRPAAFNLASVVSWVDWAERQRVPQRRKLTTEARNCRGFRNPRQACYRCGAPTPTPDSMYCDQHRNRRGRRPKFKTDVNTDSPPPTPRPA